VDNRIFQGNLDGARETLASAGFTEGRNLRLEVRTADFQHLSPIAADIVKLRPDLVFAVARSAVTVMHAATSTIPVVTIDLESDPVASGFIRTLARPGGNLTGVFLDFPELAGKWLEILKMIVPALARVAVLWDPSTGPAQLDAARRAAASLKLTVHPVEARTTGEIDSAFSGAMRERANGMISLTSPIFNSGRQSIIDLAARHRLPTLVPFPGYARDGGLASYGPDVKAMYAQAGGLTVKILRGTPPGEVPVERPTKFELVLNLKTARALGLKISQALLARADQVIE